MPAQHARGGFERPACAQSNAGLTACLCGGALTASPPPPAISGLPRRIVCLTEEATETLYLLGEEARIVGISGFTVRPPPGAP